MTAPLSEPLRRPGPGLHESRTRSIAKAVSWRVFGTLDTLILSFVVLHFVAPFFHIRSAGTVGQNFETASYIAIAEVATKTCLYFLHERVWVRFRWGRWADRKGRGRDGVRRSTAKAVSWRCLASLDTTLLAFIFTGNAPAAFSIGGAEIVTKLLLYFAHERVWSRIPFGLAR